MSAWMRHWFVDTPMNQWPWWGLVLLFLVILGFLYLLFIPVSRRRP